MDFCKLVQHGISGRRCVRVRPSIQQHCRQFKMPIAGGQKQRRRSGPRTAPNPSRGLDLLVDVSANFEQRSCRVHTTVTYGKKQCRKPRRQTRIQIRTAPQERLYSFRVPFSGRPHQSGLALVMRRLVGVGAVRQKRMHGIGLTSPRRSHQHRLAA